MKSCASMSQHKKRFDNYNRDVGINQKPKKASQTDRSKKNNITSNAKHNADRKTRTKKHKQNRKRQPLHLYIYFPIPMLTAQVKDVSSYSRNKKNKGYPL